MTQQTNKPLRRSYSLWAGTAGLLMGLALCPISSPAESGLPYKAPFVPVPSFRIVPISDGAQHTVESSWATASVVIGPGDGVVAGINNRNEILFRAGGIYHWDGAKLTLERRVRVGSPAQTAATSQTAAAAPTQTAAPDATDSTGDTFAAWAINNAGDVLASAPGGLYWIPPGGNTSEQPMLIVPNLHAENLNGHGHGLILGGFNDQSQVVGDIEVVDAEKSAVSSKHVAIFWQAGHACNIEDAPIMTEKPAPTQTDGETVNPNRAKPNDTKAEVAKIPHEPLHVYDWGDGPQVNHLTFAACGINDTGQMIGVFFRLTTNLELPVLLDGGHWRIIQTPEGVNGLIPEGINNETDIVGAARIGPENDIAGLPKGPLSPPDKNVATLVYKKTAFDLNSCIPKDSGWHLLDAVGINDRGEIVGWGTYHDKPMSFLLIPTSGGQ